MPVSPEKRALTAFVPVMAPLLLGCGRSGLPAAGASTAAPAPAASLRTVEEPLKAAFVYIGPVGHGGWTYAHDQARKTVEAELGDRVKTTYVENVPEGEAALDLILDGADVLIQNSDSPEVLKAAQEKDVMAFGWDSDMTRYGPKAHLGSAVIDWAPYYKMVVQAVSEGTWKAGTSWLGARQNAIRIASPNPSLSHDVIMFLGEKTHALKSGGPHPFAGPVMDRDGHEVVPAGARLDDASLRRMNYFVHGVKGKIPG